jgi:hypothetical protein
MISDLARQNLPSAAAAFVAMGAWAMFANRAHGWSDILLAGMVQGALSACITQGLKRLIETLMPMFSGWLARVAPPLACCAASVALLSAIHTLSGTPEIAATMAVPVLVSTLYATAYTHILYRHRITFGAGANHE